jgi:hypothetical protein
MKHMSFKHALGTFAVGAALVLTATAPKASADDHGRTRCQRQVEKAQDKYRHEVREHGRRSRQADEARARLNNTWDRCWNQSHGWYDPTRREWRNERDWDRNYDWDHDRDDRR